MKVGRLRWCRYVLRDRCLGVDKGIVSAEGDGFVGPVEISPLKGDIGDVAVPGSRVAGSERKISG